MAGQGGRAKIIFRVVRPRGSFSRPPSQRSTFPGIAPANRSRRYIFLDMTGSEWQKVKSIFNSAVELTPGERDAYLADACASDDDLRREVEKLLDSYRSEFMEAPAREDANGRQLTPGSQLGRYEIVELLGVGGMGEVYLARDSQLDR